MGTSATNPDKEIQMSKIDQVVFVIDGGEIIEGTIRNFDGYIDETTTPHGVDARYHVRENELWTWGVGGNNARLIRAYDTEAEAIEALEDSFAHDFWNCADILAFATREAAEECLAQNDD